MPTEAVTALAQATRGFVIAAAGCGKTEAIAQAIAALPETRQLVLTHTHAGVKAIRDRLGKLKVPAAWYRVDTIAGWALRYAASYPGLSGLQDVNPTGAAWSQVYGAAGRVLSSAAIQGVVAESYDGLFVDEYQDCTENQHRLVMLLADLLPCRLLGDPLQGIFGFKERLVNWKSDIEPYFERLPGLKQPWRWRNNRRLGDGLQRIREALLRGDEIDLGAGPIEWRPCDQQAQACFARTRNAGESVVAIHRDPWTCHRFASRMRGTFTSMEEMDCKDLMKWSDAIESASGVARCEAVVDFAVECMTQVSSELRGLREKLATGIMPEHRHARKYPAVISALTTVASEPSLAAAAPLLRAVGEIPGRVLYRRELWREMQRSIALYLTGTGTSLRDAAWQVRNRLRRHGRSVEPRTVLQCRWST